MLRNLSVIAGGSHTTIAEIGRGVLRCCPPTAVEVVAGREMGLSLFFVSICYAPCGRLPSPLVAVANLRGRGEKGFSSIEPASELAHAAAFGAGQGGFWIDLTGVLWDNGEVIRLRIFSLCDAVLPS